MIPPDILKSNRDITPEERHFVKQLAEDTDSKLKAVQRAIASLKQEEKELLKTAKNCQLALSPIRMLPRDVIGEIFLACVSSEEHSMSRKKAPVLLTRICSAFREIALSMPTLWAKIPVIIPEFIDPGPYEDEYRDDYRDEDEDEDDNRIAQLKLYFRSQVDAIGKWISLSGTVPLSIKCTSRMESNMLQHFEEDEYALAEVLRQSAGRWRHLSLRCQEYSHFFVQIIQLTPDDVPLLSSLHIFNEGDEEFVSGNISQARKLAELSLKGWSDVSKYNVDWSQLTRLTLDADESHSTAEILRRAQNLVHLSVNGEKTDHDINDICLPHLRELTVRTARRNYTGNRLVAGYIQAPALETLHADVSVLLLTSLVKRSPHLRNLEILDVDPNAVRTWLRNCPQITSLVMKTNWNVSSLLEEFLLDRGGTYTCPNLRKFHYPCSRLEVSLGILSQFLGAEHGGSDTPLKRKWEQVNMAVFIYDWHSNSNDEKAKAALKEVVEKLQHAGVLRLRITNYIPQW